VGDLGRDRALGIRRLVCDTSRRERAAERPLTSEEATMQSDGQPGRAGFRTVVLPLDGAPRTERLLDVALEEARVHAAPLVLIHVVPFAEPPENHPSHGPQVAADAAPPPEIASACGDARRYLEGLAERCGADAEIVVRHGDPFRQISRELARRDRPLVIFSVGSTALLPVGEHSELARRIAALGDVHVLLAPVDADPPHDQTGVPWPM